MCWVVYLWAAHFLNSLGEIGHINMNLWFFFFKGLGICVCVSAFTSLPFIFPGGSSVPLERLLSAEGRRQTCVGCLGEESLAHYSPLGNTDGLEPLLGTWACLPGPLRRSFYGKRFLEAFASSVLLSHFTTICIRSTDKATMIGCCPHGKTMVDGPIVIYPNHYFSQSVRFQI